MKNLIYLVSALLICVGCGQSGGGSNHSAMGDFRRNLVSTFQGGATLPDGDYAKYKIYADDTIVCVEVEVRNGGRCSRASGVIPVKQIGGTDANGQSDELRDMSVQVQPQDDGLLDYNTRFVHMIITHMRTVDCSGAPAATITEAEFKPEFQRHFFSDFGLTMNQLKMASAALIRGSSTFMLYFASQDLGLAFDSATEEVVGVDIPKHALITNYLFTTNRSSLRTDNIPKGELFPLMMTADDLKTHMKTTAMVRELQSAVKLTNGESSNERQNLINSVWWGFFNK